MLDRISNIIIMGFTSMKICLLAPANNPHTQKLAYSLKHLRHEVFIYTFHPDHLEDINVYKAHPLYRLPGKANYFLSAIHLSNFLKRLKPDILHAHYVSSYGVIGTLTGFHPFIISVWGMDIYNAPKNLLLRPLIQYALFKADYVMSTSKTMYKQTRKYLKDKPIAVTPFGIDFKKFYPRPKKSKKFIIGTARILAPKYGIKYLIEAFTEFAGKISNTELLIAGQGPQQNELKQLCKRNNITDKVKFLGFVPPDQMPRFLCQLDVFCMPSIEESESFGVAALEAQACGLPVIASDIGGLPETVQDNLSGFLVHPKNAQEISKKLYLLVKDTALLKRLSHGAIQFVRENYDWEKNIKRIIDIYNKF